MKNKFKLIVIFFLTTFSFSIFGLVVKIPIYKTVQFSSIKLENTYRNFITFNGIDNKNVNKLILNQSGNEFIILKNQMKFNDKNIAEIKNIDNKFNPNIQTSAVVMLNSERIMYYLINKTFSRK
ncbi:hypothetical protein STIUS_v1c04210 [Spiroplasma sp. TIUS-1]|uniref:hypothetical protein n=1 Tax=Spiroplasma sp. TIUS-1 TaxID=216963 RepID=UPI001398D8AE|nr:hypothetical protein [Spiroplasma sp. TIUS-1]QHX35975.1 hypothetical protein STIUS_v1c04210 [Spiroplasma sp. TIUS-1]